jgi:hypothetical protein
MSAPDHALSGPRALKKAGSPDWCWQTVDLLKQYLYNIEQTWRQADEVVDELRTAQAWKVLPAPEKPYGSFDRLCRELLGMRAQDVQHRIDREKIKALGPHRGSTVTERNTRVRDTNSSITQGDNSEYVVSRLKRDDPALAERVVRGEVTPNAAAREKGWRKPRIVLSSPERIADSLSKYMPKEALARLVEHLVELLTQDDAPE